MTVAKTERLSHDLGAAVALARLLERLEGDPTQAGGGQYQLMVRKLGALLEAVKPGPGLTALLDNYPAAAQVYENLHYAHAGLCRSPLEAATQAEQLAVQAISRARRAG